MRILFLTQWFQPEPCFKGLPFAKALQGLGHEVEVLTGFPNYPGGKVYPGYRIRLWQCEMMDGIRVYRVPLYPSHDKSALRRILNYVSFGLSSAAIGPFLVRKPDVIYVYNLITLSLASLVLRLFHRCPVVYDIQDLWPDSVVNSGMLSNHGVLQVLNRLCQVVYHQASHLVTLSPGIKAELVRRGIPETCISMVYNWCDEEYYYPLERDESMAAELGLSGRFVVMSAGNMGVTHGLDSVIQVAERLSKAQPSIKFVFAGGGVEQKRMMQTVAERGLTNVVFIERQPIENMAAILALADVMVVHLKDTPLSRISPPSRIQAYLAASKPILMGVRGDAAEIIRASGAGEVVTPEDPESIAEGLLKHYALSGAERRQMGVSARNYYQKFMCMQSGVRTLDQIFKNTLDKFRL